MTEKELTRLYRQTDAQCARIADRLRSNRDFEPYLFIPTYTAKAEVKNALNDLLEKCNCLPAPDPVFSILKNHFNEYLKGQMSNLEYMYQEPSGFIAGITRFLGFIGRKDSRFAEERAFILERRLHQIDELWNAVIALLPNVSAQSIQRLVNACEPLT